MLTLDVERVAVAGQEIRVQGGLKVSVRGVHRGRLEVLEAGDRVVFWARLRPPSYFRNPGGFDGAAYLARQEIELLGSTKSGLLVTLDEKGPLWSSFISRLRLRALRRLERALSEETFGVVAALVTGERAGLSPELQASLPACRHLSRHGHQRRSCCPLDPLPPWAHAPMRRECIERAPRSSRSVTALCRVLRRPTAGLARRGDGERRPGRPASESSLAGDERPRACSALAPGRGAFDARGRGIPAQLRGHGNDRASDGPASLEARIRGQACTAARDLDRRAARCRAGRSVAFPSLDPSRRSRASPPCPPQPSSAFSA